MHLRNITITVFLLFSCQPKQESLAVQKSPWEKLGPGGGGSTFIPTFSYHSSDDFVVRCDMTGSYVTDNGGNSYHQVNFPGGAQSYAYDPYDSGSIWIGSSTLNHSSDGGVSWEQVFPRQNEILSQTYYDDHASFRITVSDSSLYASDYGHISAIRVDPRQQGVIYFSMGPYFFYSADEGKTWSREKVERPIEYIYANAAGLNGQVLIFTSRSLYRFSHSSRTLVRQDFPEQMSPAFSFSGGTEKGSSRPVIYALHHDQTMEIDGEFGHTEVWKSPDAGLNWLHLDDPHLTNALAGAKPSFSMIACAELDAAKVYVVTNRYEEKTKGGKVFWYGALSTKNGGDQWEWVWKGGGGSGQYGVKDGIGVRNLKDAWVDKAFGGEYIRLMDVGVYPRDGNVAVVTDWYRLMKTTDGGKTWNQIYSDLRSDSTFSSTGLDVTTAYNVHFDPFDSNHIAISYTDIGYHHSFNRGKSWTRSANGVPTDWVNTCYGMVFDPDVKGKAWSVWSGLHDFPRGKMTRDPQWKEKGAGGVCVSIDGGKTWQPTVAGMGGDSPATSIVVDRNSPAGNRTLYASVFSKGVFKSTDDGKTWALKNNGIGPNTCAFELTMTTNGNLFLTVSATPMHKDGKKGMGYYAGAVYKSTDGAESWLKLQVTSGPLFPNGMECDPDNPNRLYLACWAGIQLSDLVGGDVVREHGGNRSIDMPGGIFLSEDGGLTWTSIFDQNQYVYDVTADPYHPGRLYCNTFNRAAYRSDDYGKTWRQLLGYDFHWGHRVVVDRNDPEEVFLTTYGSSVWHGAPFVE